MKVLISTNNIGDSYTFSLDLARNLQQSGTEVFLAVNGSPLTEQQKQELEFFDYSFAEYKQEWMDNPWDDIRDAGQWLLKVYRFVQPDLVHLNSFTFAALPWDVPVITMVHSCELTRWKALHKSAPPKKWERYRQQAQNGLQASDVVVAPSYMMLSNAERLYGPFKRSRVIPYGRNSYDFRTSVKEKYIFSEGNILDDSKNIRIILDVAPHINYPIYIAGDNDDVEINNLPENVFFTGTLNQQQKTDWLASAFIYLLPARYEPFGYSFIDAAFSKCALIGGNIPSLREIWHDAMIYIRSKEELIYEVNDLMDNVEELYIYGQKAYERAHENYRLEKMINRYKQLYQKVLTYASAQ